MYTRETRQCLAITFPYCGYFDSPPIPKPSLKFANTNTHNSSIDRAPRRDSLTQNFVDGAENRYIDSTSNPHIDYHMTGLCYHKMAEAQHN